MRKGKKILLLVIIALLIFLIIYIFTNRKKYDNYKQNDYSSYYNKNVIINKKANIYIYENGEYIENGMVYKNAIFMLDENYDEKSGYFKIQGLGDNYYVKYDSFDKCENYYQEDNRYKKYIVFNENVVTKDETSFYKDGNKLYTINKSFNLPIIIKEDDKYYVEYNNMLLYILKEDVNEIIDSNNTEDKNINGVGVLNYHFVYKPEEETCDQEICHTEEQFRTHLSYIKDNGYFTPTMNELEMYIDGKLQLPQSVVITIDDGRNVNLATDILEEYKLNATAFIVTGRYNMETDFIKSEYVEMQSHSHNLHDAGTCPPGHGQGGGLTCLNDEEILNDIKMSREALNGATAFCYPFYEYNEHAIELLKQGGVTMAFAGESPKSKNKATVGMDKFRIPRFVIVSWTTMDDFTNYLADV